MRHIANELQWALATTSTAPLDPLVLLRLLRCLSQLLRQLVSQPAETPKRKNAHQAIISLRPSHLLLPSLKCLSIILQYLGIFYSNKIEEQCEHNRERKSLLGKPPLPPPNNFSTSASTRHEVRKVLFEGEKSKEAMKLPHDKFNRVEFQLELEAVVNDSLACLRDVLACRSAHSAEVSMGRYILIPCALQLLCIS